MARACVLSARRIAFAFTSFMVFVWVLQVGFHKPPPQQFVETVNNTSKPGTILLWNSFFGDRTWGLPGMDDAVFKQHQCPSSNCRVTVNKDYRYSANLILIHCMDSFFYWPSVYHPKQNIGLFCWEAPPEKDLSKFDNHLNMTITYRSDSDVSDLAGRTFARDLPQPGRYIPRIPLAEKTKSVFWMVSHCTTKSRREDYVAELAKYIDVDIYGKCGKNSCPKNKMDECYQQFERQYKFYLALENNLCKDYVTEKLFLPLSYELIPVVFGAGDYHSVAPPKSYINVEDFKSPQALAEYLKYLSSNDTAYNEYFQWKQTHTISGNAYLWCKICESLMEGHTVSRPLIKEFNKWWSQGICRNEGVVERLLGQ